MEEWEDEKRRRGEDVKRRVRSGQLKINKLTNQQITFFIKRLLYTFVSGTN